MTIGMHDEPSALAPVHNALARAVPEATVAVDVDEIDHVTHTGRSAAEMGPADTVVELAELAELWRWGGPEPWAPGVRTLFVRVVPRRVTGRRIEAR